MLETVTIAPQVQTETAPQKEKNESVFLVGRLIHHILVNSF
ncbi:hypothetical protein Q5C_09315 [Leuconostoc pseudomesenteroides 4882]|nr:hypothetical protein Q5C_09315 [Leuconostoc pseudomesenteroides 4882]